MVKYMCTGKGCNIPNNEVMVLEKDLQKLKEKLKKHDCKCRILKQKCGSCIRIDKAFDEVLDDTQNNLAKI